MTPETARNIIQLLLRADLKGHEVPAFNQIMTELTPIANPEPVSAPASAPPGPDLTVYRRERLGDGA
jgi:hypothetical protein